MDGRYSQALSLTRPGDGGSASRRTEYVVLAGTDPRRMVEPACMEYRSVQSTKLMRVKTNRAGSYKLCRLTGLSVCRGQDHAT